MRQDPLQVLRAAAPPMPAAPRPRLLIAGATGVLGNEVLRRLAGSCAFSITQVLAREPIREGLRGVRTLLVPGEEIAAWPPPQADVAVVLFDPPRLFYQRERACGRPRRSSCRRWRAGWRGRRDTLASCCPHAPGRLPEALKRGLANLDEQAVASAGFERLLILRSAQKPAAAAAGPALQRLAHWMLGAFKYMVPSAEQPVRAVKVAELLAAALRRAPPGIHVAAPEQVWRVAQGPLDERVRDWLG